MAIVHEPSALSVPPGHEVCPSVVLDAVSCLVLVADLTTGEVVSVNSAVEALTGLASHEVVGTAWEKLFDEADQDSVRAAIGRPGGSGAGLRVQPAHPRRRPAKGAVVGGPDQRQSAAARPGRPQRHRRHARAAHLRTVQPAHAHCSCPGAGRHRPARANHAVQLRCRADARLPGRRGGRAPTRRGAVRPCRARGACRQARRTCGSQPACGRPLEARSPPEQP